MIVSQLYCNINYLIYNTYIEYIFIKVNTIGITEQIIRVCSGTSQVFLAVGDFRFSRNVHLLGTRTDLFSVRLHNFLFVL